MRIDLRDQNRRWLGRVEVDPAGRPTRVNVQDARRSILDLRFSHSPQPNGQHAAPPPPPPPPPEWAAPRQPAPPAESPAPREAFLNWDTALDDAGQLRRCVVCGCTDMFHEKAFPLVTGLVVALAFVGAIIGALGLADNPSVLVTMICVLFIDVAILVFSRRRLVCYSCRSTYHKLPIARYHRPWDRAVADRYPPPAQPAAPAPSTSAITSEQRKGLGPS
ncbi:MAG: hypothetical protein L0Y44_07235 [Phycisphaerales bacterium]|nr:hypothetical protein [Phycisphaerales bacterium]